MMKKVLLIILFIGSLYGLSFSAERQTLVDGDGVELGTASNPLYVTGGSSSSDSKWEEVSGTLQPLTQSNNVSISNNLTVTTINYVNPTTGYTLDFVADKGQSTNQDLTISDSGAVSFTLHSTDSNSAALNFYRGTATDAYYDYRWKDDSGYMQFQKRGTDGIWVTEFEIIDETFDVHVRNDLTVDKSVSIGANLWVGGVKYTGGGLFTDGGAATYLTATDDDLALGGTTSEGSKFYMDVSEGDLSLNNSLTARGVLYGTELRTSGTGHGIIDSDTATLVINDSLNVQGDISGTGNLTAATAIFAPNAKLSNLQSQTGVTYFATVDATGELGKSATPFGAGSGSGGGISNVVEDTTPQLGGELDCNGKAITDATDFVDIKDGLSISNGLTVTGPAFFNQNNLIIDGTLTTGSDLTARNVYTTDMYMLDVPLATFLTLTSNKSSLTTVGVNVTWGTPTVLADIPYNTVNGELSLTGGNTYELEAQVFISGAIATKQLNVVWYDITNATTIKPAMCIGNTAPQSSTPIAKTIYTPAANADVALRITLNTDVTQLYAGYSYAYVKTIRRKR